MEEKVNGGAGTLTAEASTAFGGVAAGGLMCLMSMSSIQFGAALSSSAITTYGPAGASWLRLAFAAIILAVFVRPRIVSYTRAQWTSALVLGTTTALMTMSFFAAIERIPLGLAVAIDFLGPLSVATIGYGLGRRLIWPLLAGLGVLALAHNGDGWVGNLEGILFALGAGTGWAIYIVLTKKIGASFKGLEGLSMSLMVAALVATPFGFAGAVPALDGYGLIEMAGLAILVPLLPYTLELIALRRMPTAAFGILMSLEPAIAALAGFVILAQPMTLLQMAGTALVVAASAGATFSARQ
ncbi:EamA family transporter [Rhizobium hidalgonense]|uniref:EamA family transporter n=1 Tax=Rhizobium hidalgonense TaxID=1538159 RepID=UPI00027D30FE|nr:EamA family transporter [Rhizobium hidalgonense]EJC74670.1 putative permease, DMT superfamily [Rhizobium leguminosarum bv. trifolii WSM2012]QKK25448.1 EamA family transporter [Rhizobium hidalgonense]RWX14779.1 EamA family transporter [Rhizobium hidalgonense]